MRCDKCTTDVTLIIYDGPDNVCEECYCAEDTDNYEFYVKMDIFSHILLAVSVISLAVLLIINVLK